MVRPVYAYGVVILPPPDVQREVLRLRRRHPVLHASVPPHISVKAPFVQRGTGAWVSEALEEVAESFDPFELALCGMASFGTNVIYVRVEESPELRRLHDALVESLTGYVETLNERYEGNGYTPHLTIADKLTADDYTAARRVLNGYFPRRRFEVDAIHLLRGRGRWVITRSYPLGP